MTKNRKILVALLILATVILAGVSIAISTIINNQNLQSQTGAQTNPILANCNSTTNVCSIPSGVCDPSKVFIHFCNDVKKDNEKCISANPIEVPNSPLSSGNSVDLNQYLDDVDCGTVQMYLELNTSNVNSLGACGTTIKRFASACGDSTVIPTSFPSTPVNPQTGTNNQNNNGSNNTIDDEDDPTPDNGGVTQLIDPQFRIVTSYAPSCTSSGSALLKYTVSVSNISTVSGTITKVEEVIDTDLSANSIVPANISNAGTLSGNKITWAESSTARTYSAGQTKTYTYEITIPLNKLKTFENGQTSTSTVTYNTSSANGNSNTFALTSKHNCTIPTTNTQKLPETGIEEYTLLLIGLLFIIAAIIFFRFQIGEEFISKMIKHSKNK